MNLKTKPLVARNDGGEFELPPEDTMLAVCVAVIDLGNQENKFFNKVHRQVLIMWELPEEMAKNGKPHTVQKFYNLSLHENANLRKDLEAWRGKAFAEKEIEEGFQMRNLLGKWCYLSVVHKQRSTSAGAKTRAEISSIAKLRKSDTEKTQDYEIKTEPLYFDFNSFNWETFKTIPGWIQQIMKNSLEMKQVDEDAPPPTEEWEGDGEIEVTSEDIPF